MNDSDFYRLTELDRTNWPEVRDQILRFDHDGSSIEPRTYPGFSRWDLAQVRARLWPSLDRAIGHRRSARRLGVELPSRKQLSRLLRFAHGVNGDEARGPTPSAGGLQALELYVACFTPGWLPAGLYHFDRVGFYLSQISEGADRGRWVNIVPSLSLVEGGALLWVVVGDGGRVTKKYGPRGYRFLLLEAGHLMQNLCLLSATLGMATVPLGGFFEAEIAKEFTLPPTDLVAYVGISGIR